ncbi:hypothetical protein COZ14_00945 [Candidatus Dojkabacteria bacterium CG_4_10_14_3_um_filter_Dojkabacteria_WS6_41_9]|uniref:Transcription regulator TrmB N-terminal domain-containing protein n=1 Tax=Candidatus Dojkabacteria bacterium CG_4_10_14_0_2_um_filter_Dojkabacteria_WS6_41_15 TaxID=2014249 RepID=A0A2M7W0U4_9BACT|nr:MAG: hypothetical protein COZ14_00945 [Candidatus Dojkabacteria bacterium CG_4_10_14_3_um_filter_Dojkabacteria_WS6_41_9]PJA12138.1 MAG: hypothetical protein COX64_05025 [Candidatus Dojkabacteria bacterium CG_4_10_14_0_2_um_filter_Dojkabacteria_WS6_41_15]
MQLPAQELPTTELYKFTLVVVNTTTQLSEALDLTPNEIKIYQGFIKTPGVSAAKMSGLLHMDKSSTYRSVGNLVEFGLLYQSPVDDVMTYKPADPEMLRDRFTTKLHELENARDSVGTFVSAMVSTTKRKTQVRVEEGLQAVQRSLTESLECKEKLIRERYRYHSFFQNRNHVKFVLSLMEERVKRGIWIHQYGDKGIALDPDIKKIEKTANRYLKELRVLPPGMDDMNSIRIWDDTTNITSEDERGEIVVITIVDRYVATFMKKMFDYIWSQSKKA